MLGQLDRDCHIVPSHDDGNGLFAELWPRFDLTFHGVSSLLMQILRQPSPEAHFVAVYSWRGLH